MKYFLISVLFLFNNELISLLTLSILMLLFFADIVKERFFS